jgi:hypothetical protein
LLYLRERMALLMSNPTVFSRVCQSLIGWFFVLHVERSRWRALLLYITNLKIDTYILKEKIKLVLFLWYVVRLNE